MSHEDTTHSPAPLSDVDPTPLHAAVDALAATLHEYVEAAVGVRAEFGAAESDDDPRILALENHVGQLNAGLFDALHDTLGMHPDLTSSVWEPSDGDDEHAHELVEAAEEAEVFYLGFVVAAPHEGAAMTLDGMIDLLDEVGDEATNRFADGGYDVVEWAASRGAAPGFGEDDDEEAE
ncbi:hypothetical protein [Xylanimonas ulmi]|uniref:Uncharacterized protein n=1 Tax=Xylanimonas ulmi TaxID=228973 RepID=A0A4Q7M3Y8_9MICO|nr:hypothetical protein [Xylanibacterium ulmi]RZS61713.1 hypothetical protein EV386_2024 [Xylanibacterium ulmi]